MAALENAKVKPCAFVRETPLIPIGQNATGTQKNNGFRRVCRFRGIHVRSAFCTTGFCTALSTPSHGLREVGFEGLQVVLEVK